MARAPGLAPDNPVNTQSGTHACAMTHGDRTKLGFLAKLVIVIAVALIVAGLLWHDISFTRFWNDLVERATRPMRFRLIVQPSIALIFGIRDGLRAARAGRSPYFSMVPLLRNPPEHVERFRAGLGAGLNMTARILLLALLLDAIYQFLILGTFYPFEAIVVASLLAFVPYIIIRELTVRAYRRWAATRGAG